MKALIVFGLIGCMLCASAQESDTTSNEKKSGVIVLPAIFFSPETSLGFGGASLYYFRSKKYEGSRPSNLQNIFIYTLENQILFLNPYNFFLKGEQYWLTGELGFYVYPYEYYGIGSDISLDTKESYTASYLRFANSSMYKFGEGFYAGPSVFLDQYFKIDTDPEGRLETEQIRGINPNRLFGFGAHFIWDMRNNVFCPTAGLYFEGRLLRYEEQFLGDFPFTDMYVDARKYFMMKGKWESGVQLYHQSVIGEPPFYNYAQLGGSKQMRGYFKGAYRDNHFSVFQGEVRRYIFDRILVSAFGGVGTVYGQEPVDKLLGSYGVGIRYEINPVERIRIRLDYARGHNTSGFYININEAF